MKSLHLLALLFPLVLFLAGCSKHSPPAAVERPTASETQDFKDGQAFGQTRYDQGRPATSDPSAYSEYDLHFDEAGEFLNHSALFSLGAFYQEYDNMSRASKAYVEVYMGKVDNTELTLSKSVANVAWARLADKFKKSNLTYDQFAKLVGKSPDECQQILENKPYQDL